MRRKTAMTARRMLCLLLCIAMLPLCRVTAASFNDAYNALAAIAKTGQLTSYTNPRQGRFSAYDYGTKLNGNEYSIVLQTSSDPTVKDTITVSKWRSDPSGAYVSTAMYLYFGQNYLIQFSRYSVSADPSGAMDANGFYSGQADAYWDSESTLDADLVMYNDFAAAGVWRLKADFRKDIRDLLEFVDKMLRERDSGLSIQDLFKRIPSRSVHTVGASWTERAETCTVDGLTGYLCSVCGARFYESIRAHHNWYLAQTDVPATAVHGTGQYWCSRCGDARTDAICISRAFTDMPAYDDWAHPGIDWAVYNGVTKGTAATLFSPDASCTRAQVVTFLWRAAGSPAPGEEKTPFTDVDKNAFYYDAMRWAVEREITLGTTPTTFSPDKVCTRGQIAAFLWRFRGAPAAEHGGARFTDVREGAYYAQAVEWAQGAGVAAGLTPTDFGPDRTCTRAQAVTFLYRAMQSDQEEQTDPDGPSDYTGDPLQS